MGVGKGKTLRATEELGVGSTVQIEVAQRPRKETKKLENGEHANDGASITGSLTKERGREGWVRRQARWPGICRQSIF